MASTLQEAIDETFTSVLELVTGAGNRYGIFINGGPNPALPSEQVPSVFATFNISVVGDAPIRSWYDPAIFVLNNLTTIDPAVDNPFVDLSDIVLQIVRILTAAQDAETAGTISTAQVDAILVSFNDLYS